MSAAVDALIGGDLSAPSVTRYPRNLAFHNAKVDAAPEKAKKLAARVARYARDV